MDLIHGDTKLVSCVGNPACLLQRRNGGCGTGPSKEQGNNELFGGRFEQTSGSKSLETVSLLEQRSSFDHSLTEYSVKLLEILDCHVVLPQNTHSRQ